MEGIHKGVMHGSPPYQCSGNQASKISRDLIMSVGLYIVETRELEVSPRVIWSIQ